MIFSRPIWEGCGLCPVFACCTLAFALQLRENNGINLTQGSRKVTGGHESACAHGRLLRVDRISGRLRSPCFREPGSTLGQRIYEGHLESKERFAIQSYLLIIGKKHNMQVLSHTFTYFSTQSPWTLRHLSHRDTSLLIPSSYQTAAWLFIGSP